MIRWDTHVGSDAEWDSLVIQLGTHSPFAMSGWAQSKVGGRWSFIRGIGTNEHGVNAAVQVQYLRIFGGFVIAWVPGGIATPSSLDTTGLSQWLRTVTRARTIYVRVSFHQPHSAGDEVTLRRQAWDACPSFIGARETFVLERMDGQIATTDRLSSNWKRNLQRGMDRNGEATVWSDPDPAEVSALSQEMIDFKKSYGPRSVADSGNLQSLFTGMRDHLLVVQVRDTEGNLIAVRGAYVVGEHAWDAIAAAGVDARRNYSSYVCAWKLLTELDSRQVTSFDLAGVDEQRNVGVFNFKKGFGGQRIAYLGEWDWASSQLVQKVARTLVSRLG